MSRPLTASNTGTAANANKGDRGESFLAHEDQYLWKAQNAYPDNDHMNKATERPAPKRRRIAQGNRRPAAIPYWSARARRWGCRGRDAVSIHSEPHSRDSPRNAAMGR